MPKGADYDKKHKAVIDMLYSYHERGDFDGMAAYMKQQYIKANLSGNIDVENNPIQDAMQDFVSQLCAGASEDPKALDNLKELFLATSRMSTETACNAVDRLEEIEDQIRNGEIEYADYWAETPKKTEKMAMTILCSKTEYSKELTAARGVGQLFNTAIDELMEENNNMATGVITEVLSYFQDTVTDGVITERSKQYQEGQTFLNRRFPRQPEKRRKAEMLFSGQTNEEMKGYCVLTENIGAALTQDIADSSLSSAYFDGMPEIKAECKKLTDEELEARKQGFIEKAAAGGPQKDKMNQYALECGYEQQERAMVKADPKGMEKIRHRHADIKIITDEQDKLKVFQSAVEDLITMTDNATAYFRNDKMARGKLDENKHKEYLDLTERASDLYNMSAKKSSPKEILDTLREVRESAQRYRDTHTIGGYVIMKRHDGRERIRNAKMIRLLIEENLPRLEAMANELQADLGRDRTIDERYNELEAKKTSIRTEINAKKAEIKEKASKGYVAQEDKKAETLDDKIANAQKAIRAAKEAAGEGNYPDKEKMLDEYAVIATAYHMKRKDPDKNAPVDEDDFAKNLSVIRYSKAMKNAVQMNTSKELFEQADADHAQDIYQSLIKGYEKRQEQKTRQVNGQAADVNKQLGQGGKKFNK